MAWIEVDRSLHARDSSSSPRTVTSTCANRRAIGSRSTELAQPQTFA